MASETTEVWPAGRKWPRFAIFRPSNLAGYTSLIIAGGLFLATLTLYIYTLAPSVVTLFDDSLEFQLVTYQLGIAHPTGYPLYTLLGKLFTFLPIGNIAYRVNLMSAVFGAATVALLYLLILAIAGPPKRSQTLAWPPTWPVHLGGIIGASLFAVGPVFWRQATIAEVYTLNACFLVALLWVATMPHRPFSLKEGESSAEEGGRTKILWLAFLTGLSLTHHRTMLLLLPALALYLYFGQKPVFSEKMGLYQTLTLSALLGLAPLLLYLYLPWRGHIGSLDGSYQNSWAGFWRQVSASGYGLFIFDNPFGHERPVAFYWNLLTSQFYTTLPGFIGLFYLGWAGQRKAAALTGVAWLSYLTFNLFYRVSDIEVFFIPAFLIWAAWSGVGAAFLLQTATILKYRRWRPVLGLTFLMTLAIVIFQLFRLNYPAVAQSYTWEVHDYGLDMLQQPLPEEAVIVGILGEITLLRYFQQTENRRPDIDTMAADLEAERLALLEKLLAEGRSVYLTREAALLPGAAERWSLNAVGPLIRVNPQPVMTSPELTDDLKQAVLPELTLLGYQPSRPPQHGPEPAPLRLTLFWQVTAPLTVELKLSARLMSPDGQVQAVTDRVPVHFAYPTTAWRPGEIISDVYDLTLPAGTPPGPYTPLLIWYDPARNAAEVSRIELEPVYLAGPE